MLKFWRRIDMFNDLIFILREPQYSKDEKVCSKCVDGQVLFYEKENFETAAHKIGTPKIASFSMSPGSPSHVLCYMPGNTIEI